MTQGLRDGITESEPHAAHADAGADGPAWRDWTEVMCCPNCHGELTVLAFVRSIAGTIKEGRLDCSRCHQTVAQIRQFKFDFHAISPLTPWDGTTGISESVCERRVPAASPQLERTSRWKPTPESYLYSEGRTGDVCTFHGAFTDALVRLRTQGDGGMVDVFLDNTLAASVDLYAEEGSFVIPVIAATDLAPTEHELVVTTRGESSTGSRGTAALFEELVLYGPAGLEGFAAPRPINYGNPYSEFIESYLDEALPDALALEIGGATVDGSKPTTSISNT